MLWLRECLCECRQGRAQRCGWGWCAVLQWGTAGLTRAHAHAARIPAPILCTRGGEGACLRGLVSRAGPLLPAPPPLNLFCSTEPVPAASATHQHASALPPSRGPRSWPAPAQLAQPGGRTRRAAHSDPQPAAGKCCRRASAPLHLWRPSPCATRRSNPGSNGHRHCHRHGYGTAAPPPRPPSPPCMLGCAWLRIQGALAGTPDCHAPGAGQRLRHKRAAA